MNEIIKHYESLHDGDLSVVGLQPKLDPVGIWTEGWGHAMLDENGQLLRGPHNKGKAYALSAIHTEADAEAQLYEDLMAINLLIARKIKIELPYYQLEALRSFFFNCGYSQTLTTYINTRSPMLYEWWTSHYITAAGKQLRGLVARRKTEATLFTTKQLIFLT